MKCESCGAALSLEVKFCPYCGKENVAAKKHVSDMAYYQGAFEETKKNVYEKTNKYTHNTVKIAVVAILAIVWVGTLFLVANVYSLERVIANARNKTNFSEMEAQLWEYMENEDYYAMACYCYENEIEIYDTDFEEYRPIIRLVEQYHTVYEYLLDIITPSEYDMDHLDRNVGYLADYIDYFYQCYNDDWEDMNYDNAYDMSIMQPEMDKVEKRLRVLLQAYAGLSEEEASQFAEMTTGQRIMLLEEGLLNERE